MSLLNLILPMHAKISQVLGQGNERQGNDSFAEHSVATLSQEQQRLARFEPWLLGLRNMIEEGDWHNAQVFAEQIRTRLRHLELDSKCDAAGVVSRSAGL